MQTLIIEHHKDLDHTNNNKENKLYLTSSNHGKLHALITKYAMSKLSKNEIIEYTDKLIQEGKIKVKS